MLHHLSRFVQISAVFSLLLIPLGCGDAKTAKTNGKQGGNGKASNDADFVNKAAIAGMAEVELGKLALKQSSDAEVKKFAQHMIDDHTKANDELKALAKKKNMQVPDKLDSEHQATVDRLAKLKGEEFDAEYKKVQVDDHVTAVELFENQSKNGADADWRKFAGDTLPTLQDHLKMARNLAAGKSIDH